MGSQYQSFPDARGASQTIAKLKSLAMPELRGKAFLDIGCNEGFFCAIAQGAGAARVVGIDTKTEVLERARHRFPGIEFRHQSWDDPIEGLFDGVLCASAIHYAKDQPALIDKLVALLAPGGVLVLELGIAQQPGDRYVNVQRPAGGSCDFATPDTLHRVLAGYDVREMGPSVTQRGDPVPRFVLHIRRKDHRPGPLPEAPAMVLFDAPSRSAKSTTVRLLARGAAEGTVRTLSIDGLLIRIAQRDFHPRSEHAAVHRAITQFRREHSPRTDLILPMLLDRGLFEDFLGLVETLSEARTVPVMLWDGFLPPAAREPARLYFERRGYQVWNSVPRERFNVPRLGAASLDPGSADAGAPDSAALALLKALQLPQLEHRRLLALGPRADTLCALARRAGAASAHAGDPGAGTAPFDAIVLHAEANETSAAVARAREMLPRLAPRGLLALEFAPASALERLRHIGTNDTRDKDPVALLRRELTDCVVRKVTTGTLAPRTLVAKVVHIERARPLLLIVEDIAGSESPALLRTLGLDASVISATGLEAMLAAQATLPDAPLVLCAGVLPPQRRDALLQGLVDAGFLAWELRQRTPIPYTPLDIEQALQAVFPGATLAGLAEAEQRARHGTPAATAWQRLRRLARGAVRRLRKQKPQPATLAPAATSPRRARSQEQAVTPAAGVVEGLLQGARVTAEGLELRGWAVDLGARRAVPEFVVELDGETTDAFTLVRAQRPGICQRYGMPRNGRPGFMLALALDTGASVTADRVRVGCRLGDSPAVYWLRTAPRFALNPAAQPAFDAGD